MSLIESTIIKNDDDDKVTDSYEEAKLNEVNDATNEYEAVEVVAELIVEKHVWETPIEISPFEKLLTTKFGVEGWQRIASAARKKARELSASISFRNIDVPAMAGEHGAYALAASTSTEQLLAKKAK
jgi:hypothetical protein